MIIVGNFVPLSQVRDDVAAAYLKETEWQTTAILLPYKRMCAQRNVRILFVVEVWFNVITRNNNLI